MNSPYIGKFQVTQEFKGQAHEGLDLVGLDSKEIHSTVNGTVHYAGWENSANHSHLSEIRVKAGDTVKITDVLGVEGNTGYSTGSHCHYCARPQFSSGNAFNISEISGIPNTLGVYDDGYTTTTKKTVNVTLSADGKTYSGTLYEK